jgi:hypothetical protein
MQNGAHSRWTVAYAEALFGDGACILKRVSGDAVFLRIGASTAELVVIETYLADILDEVLGGARGTVSASSRHTRLT